MPLGQLPWSVIYYLAASGLAPALDFLSGCSPAIRAQFAAVLDAVAAACLPRPQPGVNINDADEVAPADADRAPGLGRHDHLLAPGAKPRALHRHNLRHGNTDLDDTDVATREDGTTLCRPYSTDG